MRAFSGTQQDAWFLGRVGRLRASGWSRFTQHPLWRLRRRLEAQGLDVVGVFWHAPNLERCSYIVAIEDRRAVAGMLKRYHGVRFGRLKSLVSRLLNAAGLVALIAPDIAIVARPKRTRENAAVEQVTSVLSQDVKAGIIASGGSPSWLLVTPWFEASRHVLRLYMERRGS